MTLRTLSARHPIRAVALAVAATLALGAGAAQAEPGFDRGRDGPRVEQGASWKTRHDQGLRDRGAAAADRREDGDRRYDRGRDERRRDGRRAVSEWKAEHGYPARDGWRRGGYSLDQREQMEFDRRVQDSYGQVGYPYGNLNDDE